MNKITKYILLFAITSGLTALTLNYFEKFINNEKFNALKIIDPHINKENVVAYVSKIKKWLRDFPFSQGKVYSIIGANPPEVREALQNFSRNISTEIINNNSLTKEEKNRILWEAFINIEWPQKDNAFRSIIQDYLTGNNPFQIAKELRTTYQTLSADTQNFEILHDLLEITDSILKIDSKTLGNQEAQQYNNSLVYVKSLLLDQIKTIPENSQESYLISFAIDLYFPHATTNEIKSLISTIHATSSSNPEMALQLYHSIWKNILSRPSDSIEFTNLLLAYKSPQSTQSLVFLLKEDGNIVISDVPADTRNILLTHLQSLEKSSEIFVDIKTSINRLRKLH